MTTTTYTLRDQDVKAATRALNRDSSKSELWTVLRDLIGFAHEVPVPEPEPAECENCGHTVAAPGDPLCAACEAQVECSNCGEGFAPDDQDGPDDEREGMCRSCLHNARRSGWEG